MAKSRTMEFTEQHLEKLVLGLSLLLFLAAAGYWGLSSPRAVELPGVRGRAKASPGEMDQQLQDLATSVMRQVEAKEPNVPPAPDYVREIRSLFSGGRPRQELGAFGPPAVAISTTAGPTAVTQLGLTDLVGQMPAPSTPVVKAVRVLPNRQSDNQTDELVAHVLAIYPWQELREAWKQKVGTSGVPYRPTAVGVAVQVQEQLPDGGWSSPRDVTGVFEPVVDSMGTSIALPQVPRYDGTNAAYLAQLRSALATPAWQTYLLQPNYWQVWWPGYGWVDWRVNLPDNEVTKEAAALAQAAGTLGGASLTPLTPAPLYQPVRSPSYMPVTPEYDDEEEETVRPAPAETLRAQIPPPELPLVPDVVQEIQNGKVLVWIHDDSLQPLKVYRYRVAVKFLNPLLGFDNAVTDPEYAATAVVTTPFSDWSEAVEVPQSTEFFLTGASESRGRVTVFARSTGQQVKERFTVVPGQSIGEVKNIPLTNPADGSVGPVAVDFSTGAIVVQFNVTRTGGRAVVEMLYLDEKGNLQTKVDVNSLPRSDREYLRYKELEDKEKVTRLAAEAAKAAVVPAP